MRLTTRDIQALSAIATARFLTVESVGWMYWPAWERWEAGNQRPSTRAYARLKSMTDRGLLVRIMRAVTDGAYRVRREFDAYGLSAAGADLLMAAGYWDETTMAHMPRIRVRSPQNLTHSVAIGETYAALAARLARRPGRTVAQWQTDHLLRRDTDRVRIQQPTAAGGLRLVDVPILPDASALLQGEQSAIRVFVEVDRGRPVGTWAEKVAAYQAYQGSAALKDRYDVGGFLLLCLTTTERQRQRLMQATARVIGQASNRYLFGLIDDIHPLRIGDCWRRLDTVDRTTQVLNGRVVQHVTITTAPHTLIS